MWRVSSQELYPRPVTPVIGRTPTSLVEHAAAALVRLPSFRYDYIADQVSAELLAIVRRHRTQYAGGAGWAPVIRDPYDAVVDWVFSESGPPERYTSDNGTLRQGSFSEEVILERLRHAWYPVAADPRLDAVELRHMQSFCRVRAQTEPISDGRFFVGWSLCFGAAGALQRYRLQMWCSPGNSPEGPRSWLRIGYAPVPPEMALRLTRLEGELDLAQPFKRGNHLQRIKRNVTSLVDLIDVCMALGDIGPP